MLKMLFACLCLLNGCSTARTFLPIDNCIPSIENKDQFSCVDTTGKNYRIIWDDSHDLVCFHAYEFKAHEELCHEN